MATVQRRPAGVLGAADPEEAAFSQFFGTIAANPAVERIAINELGGYIDFWVRLSEDDEAREMALYDALATYHASLGVTTPVDLHVVLATERDDAFPAGLRLMYRRPTP